MDERKIELTLDQGPQAPKLVQEAPQEEKFKDIHLTPEEERQVEEFAEKIDLSNTATILEYGAGAQGQIAQFSEETLKTIRTKDLGEVGDLISSVVLELKNFDQEEKRAWQAYSKSPKTR
ncbi:toxic anion resistance protein TelA domain protein [Peptoniphilus sp. oral taxon 375 str. F0436]|nr:toxic anion resistance protein TelA domain protein [Peptoniphilus sp. oral taxon 375 str. F0436]